MIDNISLFRDDKRNTNKFVRGVIYKRTDPNGVPYVGQTIDESGRNNNWLNKKKYAGTKINDAREKYGPENFTYEILFETRSKNVKRLIQILNVMETYFIKKFDSINNGYNSSSGGNTVQAEKFPHQRAIVQLTLEGTFVKEFSSINEAKRLSCSEKEPHNIGECCRTLSNNSSYRSRRSFSSSGYIWMYKEDYDYINENDIDLMEYIQDRMYPKNQRVVQLDFEGNLVRELLYPTQYQDEGFVGEYITRILAGKRETYHGFRWMWYNDYVNSNKEDLVYKNPFCKPVVGLSFTGKLQCKYDSIGEASESVNGFSATIGQCCLYHHEEINNLSHQTKRHIKSAKSYIWMFEEDYNTIVNSELGIERYLIDKVPGANTIVGAETVEKLKQIIKQKYNE